MHLACIPVITVLPLNLTKLLLSDLGGGQHHLATPAHHASLILLQALSDSLGAVMSVLQLGAVHISLHEPLFNILHVPEASAQDLHHASSSKQVHHLPALHGDSRCMSGVSDLQLS